MIGLGHSSHSEAVPPARPRVIAAIPCLNTQKHVGEIVTRTKKYVDEIIVVDDGSQDMTASEAQMAGATVIRHGVNKGYGAAIKSCFEAARDRDADILVTIDGDGQHSPEEIPLLLDPILTEQADLVIGSRFLANRRKMPLYRKFGIGVITFLWNFSSHIKVTDTQSGFRAYGKKIMGDLSISEKGMSVSIEILEKIRKRGLNIREVPISCYYNHSSPNLNAFSHGISVAFSVVRIRLKNLYRRVENSNADWHHKRGKVGRR